MGVLESVLADNKGLIEALLKMVEGKEAKAKVNLDGVKFTIGKSVVKLEGAINFSFVPLSKSKD